MTNDEIWSIAAAHEHRYSEINIDLIEFAYAIRRSALEEAAQRVMKIMGYPPREYYAEDIRALAASDSDGGKS